MRKTTPDAAQAAERGERRGIQSMEVGGALLLALADEAAPMSLKDLSASAGMAAAKAHPYLVSFAKLGLVEQDALSGRYQLGPLALRMGLACLRRLDPVRLGIVHGARLAEQIHHSVALAVWGNAGPTVVHIEESNYPIHLNLRTGTVMSLNTATGRAFAAWLPAPVVKDYLRRVDSSQGFPVGASEADSWRSLQPLLKEVREHGLARAVGNPIPGVNAFSAPVFDHEGKIVLVLTALGTEAGFDAGWSSPLAKAVRGAADEISHRLGGSTSIPA